MWPVDDFWFARRYVTFGAMHGTARNDGRSIEPNEGQGFPAPSTCLSLRHAIAYRGVDDDGEPILIISDGVCSVALESGLAGPSPEVVVAARRLAETAAEFASRMAEQLPESKERRPGRRPPNRRTMPGPKSGTP
jgi:hypothetical protein